MARRELLVCDLCGVVEEAEQAADWGVLQLFCRRITSAGDLCPSCREKLGIEVGEKQPNGNYRLRKKH